MRVLKILPDDSVSEYYSNTKTNHQGDSGIDIYFKEDTTIFPSQTKLVDLGIKCEYLNVKESPNDWITFCIAMIGLKLNIYNTILLFSIYFCLVLFFYGKRFFSRNESYYLVPRSSISKTPLIMVNSVGIIDAGYRGEIKVPLHNLGTENYTIKKGERLFQIVSRDLTPINLEITTSLSETSRGSGGFGSTGSSWIKKKKD